MYSYLANPTTTRETLKRFELVTRHGLGQNFLVSDGVIGRILNLAELVGSDAIYEVGPGIGTLTVAMLPRVASVVAVEADRRLPPVLAETCADWQDRLVLLRGDALRMEPHQLREALMSATPPDAPSSPTKLVSNLPYQVAATVLLRTFEQMTSVRRAVVMVQAEVADRIAAHPGTKAYGAYTAKLALYAKVTGRFEVSPSNFMPAPHVDSAVVRLDRAPSLDPTTGVALTPDTLAAVSHVIDGAFAQRRKTIRNSLAASGFDRASLDAAFTLSKLAPTARAETLTVTEFIRLAQAIGMS